MIRTLPLLIIFIAGISQLVYPTIAPTVTNVTAIQRTDGSRKVDIHYDLRVSDNNKCAVSVQVSNDGGNTWTVAAVTFTGDIGPNVSAGNNKKIVWDAGKDLPGIYGQNYRVKVIAQDVNYLIDGGYFRNLYLPYLGWYEFTSTWSSAVSWTSTEQGLRVQGKGDYIPAIVNQTFDYSSIEFIFKLKLMEKGDGGLIITNNPLGTPPNKNSLQIKLAEDQPNGVFVYLQKNGIKTYSHHGFVGQISLNTWYDVSIKIEGNFITVSIVGLGSTTHQVNNLGLDNSYKVTIYGRGSWGENADVFFDKLLIR